MFLIANQTMIMVRKKLVFSSPTRKKIMRLGSVELDLRTERAGNCRKNHAYVESILNRLVRKQWVKKKDMD